MHQMVVSVFSADDRNLSKEQPKLKHEPPT